MAKGRSFASMIVGLIWLVGCVSGEQQDKPPLQETESEPRLVVENTVRETRTTGDPIADALRAGQFHNAFGDQDAAETAFRAALREAEARHGVDAPSVLGPLLQLALTVSIQQRLLEADALFARASLVIEGGQASFWDRARFKTYRAIHLSTLGELDEAFRIARLANLERRDQLGIDAKRHDGDIAVLTPGLAELAHGLAVEAALALRLGRLEVAEVGAVLARRILVRLTRAPDWWLAEIDELVAEVEAQREVFDAARDRIRTALAVKRQTFGERRPVAMTMLSLGQIDHLQGDSGRAVQRMREGIGILRGDPRNTTALGFNSLRAFLRAGLVTLAANPPDAQPLRDEMFQASQMAAHDLANRAGSLALARLTSDRGNLEVVVRELQRQVQTRNGLRLELGRAFAREPKTRDAEKLAELRREIDQASTRIAQIEGALEQSAPGLSALLVPRPVSTADLRELLMPDEALLSFVVGPEDTFLFAVGPNGVEIASLGLRGEVLAARVRALRRAFRNDITGVAGPFDLTAAHAMFRTLVPEDRGILDGVSHLIIVASGPLSSLPFGILLETPTSGLGADRYREASWLGARYAISNFPSVRSFAELRRSRSRSAAPRPMLGLADPVLTGNWDGLAALENACIDGAVAPELIQALPPLPDTAAELAAVARVLGATATDLATGRRATEPWVRSRPLAQYRVLYFATHGLLPGELRCQGEPALVLTPPETQQVAARDGLLSAGEVAMLELDADLVVLSACNTAGAAGKFGGVALSGLARSFFHAGARALLVSHWPVNSAATTRLMARLFQTAATGRSLALSLRDAKRELIGRKETSHPAFWGAFSLKGDGAIVLDVTANRAS